MGYTPPAPPPEDRRVPTRCDWCSQTCGVDKRGGCIACGGPRITLMADPETPTPQPLAVITVPARLSDAEAAHIQQRWREMFAGRELGQRLIILEEGMKLQLLSVNDARGALGLRPLAGGANG